MKSKFSAREIKTILGGYNPQTEPPPEGLKPASVLIPFYPDPKGLSLVFMKRPDYPGAHGGQISFPGGGRDPGDADDLCTALRETEEEIGVDRNAIEVWGGLNTEWTRASKYWITPFVGLVPYPY
ncbi:MAG: CoA pyrophosphatase, partial [Proteobacteria bacterium]|nr:CoA pyrophosphatase [Pseudomonadota bacterium]